MSLRIQSRRALAVCVQTRDLHGDGDGGNPTESAGNLWEWVQLLREYRRDGTKTCRNTAGMEFIGEGNPWVCLENVQPYCFFKSYILDSVGKTCMKTKYMTF